jgi:hypothetical protein
MTITDCTYGNIAYHGGGVYALDATGVIAGTTLSKNRAFNVNIDANALLDPNSGAVAIRSWGGGLCGINSPVTIRDSQFLGNIAVSSGGGVYFNGSDQDVSVSPTLHNCRSGRKPGRDGGVSVSW